MRNSHENHQKNDPIINKVDQEFSEQLTKLIKSYVLDLVNHEVDVITDSDWFDEKIQSMVFTTMIKKFNPLGIDEILEESK